MFCNVLIQSHFNYACPTWYPNLNEKPKKKIQIMQNKCIRFCLKLDKMHHISEEEFKVLNWLPTSKRVDQFINTITYNFASNICPYYLNEIFEFSPHCRIREEITFLNLKILSARQTWGKKQFLIIVPLFGTACLT